MPKSSVIGVVMVAIVVEVGDREGAGKNSARRGKVEFIYR
jgi:hypothetical protein